METFADLHELTSTKYPRTQGFYQDSNGSVGFRHHGLIEWWHWSETYQAYVKTGSTINAEGATYYKW